MFEKEVEEKVEEWLDERYLKDMGVRRPCKKAYKTGFQDGYNKCNKQLAKAKELLTKWVELFKPKGGNIPPTPIQIETEQFIREVGK